MKNERMKKKKNRERENEKATFLHLDFSLLVILGIKGLLLDALFEAEITDMSPSVMDWCPIQGTSCPEFSMAMTRIKCLLRMHGKRINKQLSQVN